MSVRLLRPCLRLGSLAYAAAIGGRNWVYDHGWRRVHRSPLPVISIGNLSVGGTGKSPMIAALARWFRARGIRVAILSRGYGQLDSGQNDEALELEMLLPDVPHLQHWDRVASAELAEKELDMQLLLLDDGFQHRRLARDLDIVLLDASDPPAARRLLPAGLMREPFRSLRRADLIVLTRVDQAVPGELNRLVQQLSRRFPQTPLVTARHQAARMLRYPNQLSDSSELNGKAVLAFCGIGNPASFFHALRELGATLLDQQTWPDHHAYTADDIATLEQWSQAFPQAELLLCTQKDWVKLQIAELGGIPLAALQIEMKFDTGEDELERLLEQARRRIGNAL